MSSLASPLFAGKWGELAYLLVGDPPQADEFTSGLETNNDFLTHMLRGWGWFMFICILALTTVIMLNLLIAMMNDTYNAQKSGSSETEWYLHQCLMVKYYSK